MLTTKSFCASLEKNLLKTNKFKKVHKKKLSSYDKESIEEIFRKKSKKVKRELFE